MRLLQEIRDGAVSSSTDLAEVLRKCMVLAYRLGHEPFRKWVEQEQNGYESESDLPDYRIVRADLRGNFTNGAYISKNGALRWEQFPPELQEAARNVRLTQSVSELDAMTNEEILKFTVPQRIYYHAAGLLTNDYEIMDLWLAVSPGAMRGVLSIIRARIVELSLSIEADDPDFELTPIGSTPIPPAQVEQKFQVIILGQGHSIQLGSGSSVVQSIEQQVISGDLASLKSFLQERGVEQEDLDGLNATIAESTKEDLEDERSGLRRWVDTVAEKLAGGSKEFAKVAVREAILLSVRHYFGDVIDPSARASPKQ